MHRLLLLLFFVSLHACTLLVQGAGPVRCDETTFFTICDENTLISCEDGFENREFCGDNGVCDPFTLTCNRCGDGILLSGIEQCDDSNDVNGDGCSEFCIIEFCGDGITNNFGEECDDANNIPGDGCSAICRLEVCGDGLINVSGEECDDNNNNDGDGCSSDCLFEGTVESEPNNSLQQADGPLSPSFFYRGAINPAGDTDVIEFEFTQTQSLRIELFDSSGIGTCNGIDPRVKLFDSTGFELDDNDDDGIQNCSLLARSNSSAVLNMQPGTYFAAVSHFNNTAAVSGYILAVTLDGLCGNDILEASEGCDDGNLTSDDGCSASCFSEICGDGIQLGNEQCDDGNLIPGDGCSASCTIEGCGNGIIDGFEQCDDANQDPFDGCQNNCTFTCDSFNSNGSIFSETQSSCYLRFTTPRTWQGAENDCIARGGHLVAISSPSEASELGGFFIDNTWLGLNDISREAVNSKTLFSNSSREPNLFDNFEVNFPVNTLGDEDCTVFALAAGGVWLNLRCSELFGYVCEVPIVSCGNGRQEPGEVCDDGNLVDGDGCDETCQHSLIALPYVENFEGEATALQVNSNSSVVRWQLDRHRAIGSQSFYMGNPVLRSFADAAVGIVLTSFTTPPFVAPVGSPIFVQLSNVRLTENGQGFDTFDIFVKTESQEVKVNNINAFNGQNFIGFSASIPSTFGGQQIQLVFRFNTVDSAANDDEGIYLDGLSIQIP